MAVDGEDKANKTGLDHTLSFCTCALSAVPLRCLLPEWQDWWFSAMFIYTHTRKFTNMYTHTLTHILKPPMRRDWFIHVIWLAETLLGKRNRHEYSCVCAAGQMDPRCRTSKCECILPPEWQMKKTNSGYVKLVCCSALQCVALQSVLRQTDHGKVQLVHSRIYVSMFQS